MSLSLTNFRTHGKYKLDLHMNEIHRIRGNSGTGKSTLFQALLWVLYGKMKKVKPWNSGNKIRAEVTLEICGRKITRRSNPDEFMVVHNDIILHGESARLNVEEWLGPRDFWLATSYMRQLKPNIFLSYSSAQKLEILNNIIFTSQSPGVYIEKVDDKLVTIGKDRLALSQQVAHLSKEYQDLLTTYSITEDEIKKGYPTSIMGIPFDKVGEVYNGMRLELETETKKQTLNESTCREALELSKKLVSITPEYLSQVEKDAKDSLEKADHRRVRDEMIKKKNELIEKITTLQEKLGKITYTHDIEPIDNSLDKIYITKKMEDDLSQNRTSFSQLGIDYDQKILEDRKSEVQKEISELEKRDWEYKSYLNKLSIYTQRMRELEETRLKLSQIGETEYGDLITELEKLKIELNKTSTLNRDRVDEIKRILSIPVMSCPHCQQHIFWSGKELVKTERYDISLLRSELDEIERTRSDEISKLQLKMKEIEDEIKRRQSNRTSKDFLSSKLNVSLEEPTKVEAINLDEIRRLKELMYKLSILRFVPSPEKSSLLLQMERDNYQYTMLSREIETLKSESDKLVIPDEITIKYTRLEAYEELRRVQTLNDMLKRYTEIKDVEVDKKRQKEISDKIEEFNRDYARVQLITAVLKKGYQLVELSVKLREVSEQEMLYNRLKEILINTEYSMYIEATNKINYYLEDAIPTLFVEPLKVKLLMFKTLKTKGRVKPSVNLHVTYNGEEVDINDFSGGEDERLSLAITIALNKISSSPFLLLDEPFAALSGEDMERSLRVLERQGRKKDSYTLCVSHDEVEGWYGKETVVIKDKYSP